MGGVSLVEEQIVAGLDIEERKQYRNGEEIGIVQRWYSSGQIKYEEDIKNNLKKEFWENGNLKSEEIKYIKGDIIKINRNYTESGQFRWTDTIYH